MKKLKDLNLIDVLNKKALEDKIPIMGICLGMQLLTNGSDEGDEDGLGWIDGYTHKFKLEDNTLKIPHMGWNYVEKKSDSKILDGFDKFKFYFVHSYYVKVNNLDNSLLSANYGINFDAAIVNDNIYGFQFHPEKSHKFGMKLFENFAKL